MQAEILILLMYSSFWMIWIAFWFSYAFYQVEMKYKVKNIFDMYFKIPITIISGYGLTGRSKKGWLLVIFGIFMFFIPVFICKILSFYQIKVGFGLGCQIGERFIMTDVNELTGDRFGFGGQGIETFSVFIDIPMLGEKLFLSRNQGVISIDQGKLV